MKMTLLGSPRMVVSVMLFGLTFMSIVQEVEARNHKPSASKVKVTSRNANTADLQLENITSMTTTCSGVSDGLISFSVSGGTAPYTAALSGGATSVSPIKHIPMNTPEMFSGLAASGIPYFITVTDASGSMVTSGSIVLVPVSPINITVLSTPPTCFGKKNGSMTVTVTDAATPPSTIVLKNCKTKAIKTITDVANGITETIQGLAAGSYCLTATDADGCSTAMLVNVQAGPLPLKFSIKTSKKSCPECSRMLTVKAKGGMAPYTYQLDNGPFQSTDLFYCVEKGKHTVTVQDAKGCKKTTQVEVS